MKCSKCRLVWPDELFKPQNCRNRRTGIVTVIPISSCVYCGNLDQQVTRHRKRGNYREGSRVPYRKWALMVRACNGICPGCQQPAQMTIDHIVPFSAGGLLVIQNLTPLCRSCNSRKGPRYIPGIAG